MSKKEIGSSSVSTEHLWVHDPREVLRARPNFLLEAMDRADTPGWSGTSREAQAHICSITPVLSMLQERLFAASKEGSQQRVLLVAQGLDTAGKGGIAKHVMGLVDPQGVHLHAFKKPTEEERQHDFLWRIRKALPGPGMIGLFDRSHYEDLLVPLANHQMSDAEFIERVETIKEFEKELVDNGTHIIKVALMVSYQEQGRRLLTRLDRRDKQWKFSSNDIDVRGQWRTYQEVYQRILPETSFSFAPWYVIPADRKWYSRLAVTEMLARTLADMDVDWPTVDYDVEKERERVLATMAPESIEAYDAKREKMIRKAAKKNARIERLAQSLA
ncbi:PPK2 family polyphosphate kinase [Actinomyces vulturis]|uniref:PPK2 family polyphosphate kinase n=1 Tax=Actinomyces vulturis TaxID=1857645 RepID=UPI0008333DD3|nr:PPK2 family polyphosphate kinase [Actinomyces vulturis]